MVAKGDGKGLGYETCYDVRLGITGWLGFWKRITQIDRQLYDSINTIDIYIHMMNQVTVYAFNPSS